MVFLAVVVDGERSGLESEVDTVETGVLKVGALTDVPVAASLRTKDEDLNERVLPRIEVL